MAQTKPILYSYFKSSCSWRVRIALAQKDIDYELKTVNLAKGEQHSENFLKLNPDGMVPIYIDNGKVITNSLAILEYLEETSPNQPLLPADSIARAQVRGIVDSIVSGIQPLQNDRVLKYVGDSCASWAKHWIESGFTSLENCLQHTHGQYCVGDTITFADLCLVPQVYNSTTRFDVEMTKFPLISEISERLNNLKAFQVSHPDNQPDKPTIQDLLY